MPAKQVLYNNIMSKCVNYNTPEPKHYNRKIINLDLPVELSLSNSKPQDPNPENLITHIWNDFDASFINPSDDDSDYNAEECEDFVTAKDYNSAFAKLPCGDIHVCKRGKFCPFLEPNDERMMVCTVTGLEHGSERTEEFFDLNGGIGKKSGDPDQNAGEILYGRCSRRFDPIAASKSAFQAADMFMDNEMVSYRSNCDAKPLKPPKRGALCVGEEDPEHVNQQPKRHRCSKKNVKSQQTRVNLHSEAENVIIKLINHKKSNSFNKPTTKCRKPRLGSNDQQSTPKEPKPKFVFEDALKRYVKSCIVSGNSPSLDVIHNINIAAKQNSSKAHQQSIDGDGIRTAKFRNLCSSFIVALWSAACSTPYMTDARRGTDAYRPFICGVLYGFKRGVTLDNGRVLIPKCPQLADALPALRGTGGNTAAKTLHSSSHRGLCTLSRCVSSVPKNEQVKAFADVTRLAENFSKERFLKSDI